ncbi:MAG: hypothetical protein LAT65_05100 [Saccharospirillum sp.]|nr:hypothetical protein [Saccharospirillum sp.]
MIYEDLYWTAALMYGLGVIGFWLVLWRLGRLLPWRPLRWWIIWIYLCIVLTPWQGTDPEPYLAPAIIVAAFDFLDVGLSEALAILTPMIQAMVIGTLVIVLLGIGLTLARLKANNSDEQDNTERT